jgi:hypothetical protein
MTAKKTATPRTTPSKPRKAKQTAAPPQKDTAAPSAPVAAPLVDPAPAAMAAEPAAVEPAPTPEPAPVKPQRTRKAPKAQGDRKANNLSALDAAAKVLAETGQALTCQELIAAMAEKGYWTSPAGKTPAATLYAAVTREISVKGKASRFRKVDRGQFALAQAGK